MPLLHCMPVLSFFTSQRQTVALKTTRRCGSATVPDTSKHSMARKAASNSSLDVDVSSVSEEVILFLSTRSQGYQADVRTPLLSLPDSPSVPSPLEKDCRGTRHHSEMQETPIFRYPRKIPEPQEWIGWGETRFASSHCYNWTYKAVRSWEERGYQNSVFQ